MTPPQRRTALERQQLLPAQRDLSQKAGGCCKGRVANSLGNTKKAPRKTSLPSSEHVQQQQQAPSSQPWFCCRGSSSTFESLLTGRPISHFSTLLDTLEKHKVCWPTASSGLTAPTALYSIKSCISWEPNYHLHSSFAIRSKL